MTERHAYLIQAHGSFGLLAKLLAALDDERNDIFVHIDSRSENVPVESLHCDNAELFFTERIPTRWGGPSQIWSELILLKAALKQGHHSYYHLVSGSDLPVKSQDYIHNFFEEHRGTEFVSFWKLKDSTFSRFEYAPLSEYGINFWGNLVNCIFRGAGLLLKRGRRSGIDFRYGPNWFSITERLAEYVVEREGWIRDTFSNRCNCDEVFLQTLVHDSAFYDACYIKEEVQSGEVSMGNLRFVDWSRGSSHRHPWVFEDADFELLSNVPHLFARKFREGTGIVDRVLEQIAK